MECASEVNKPDVRARACVCVFLTSFNESPRRGNSYLVEHSTRQMRNEWQSQVRAYDVPWFNLWYFMKRIKTFPNPSQAINARIRCGRFATRTLYTVQCILRSIDPCFDMFIRIHFALFRWVYICFISQLLKCKQTARKRWGTVFDFYLLFARV